VVAREDQARRVAALVEDREPPHAVEPAERIHAPGRVRLEHDLAVGMGAEGVPERFELGSELAEVVDLAVVDEVQPAVRGRHRLAARRDVDDAESAHPEARGVGFAVAQAIWTAMDQAVRHRLQQRSRPRTVEAGNAAHLGEARLRFFANDEKRVAVILRFAEKAAAQAMIGASRWSVSRRGESSVVAASMTTAIPMRSQPATTKLPVASRMAPSTTGPTAAIV
jgi:hypothetical protein